MSTPLKMRTARPGEPNHGLVDRYTPWHVFWGVFLGLSGMSWPVALGLSVLWEIAEHPLKNKLPEMFPNATQDTVTNSAGDVGANMLGYLMGRKISEMKTRR
jgi:hypothetical protein